MLWLDNSYSVFPLPNVRQTHKLAEIKGGDFDIATTLRSTKDNEKGRYQFDQKEAKSPFTKRSLVYCY